MMGEQIASEENGKCYRPFIIGSTKLKLSQNVVKILFSTKFYDKEANFCKQFGSKLRF